MRLRQSASQMLNDAGWAMRSGSFQAVGLGRSRTDDRIKNGQKQRRNTGILHCVQDDSSGVPVDGLEQNFDVMWRIPNGGQKQIPPLRCGMTTKGATEHLYSSEICLRSSVIHSDHESAVAEMPLEAGQKEEVLVELLRDQFHHPLPVAYSGHEIALSAHG